MPWFVQYQKADVHNAKWEVLEADKRAQAEAEGFHTAILEVDKAPAGELDQETVKYRGPLVFDIDIDSNPPDPSLSIPELNRLLDTLQTLNVNLADLDLYASGGKGFHIVIPAEIFSNDAVKGAVLLPYTYKHMAAVIENLGSIKGIDHKIYAAGRGHMIRLPNKPRQKDGRFKVPITLDEARGMDAQIYWALTSQPRAFPPRTKRNPIFATGLHKLYEDSKKAAHSAAINRATISIVPQESMQVFNDNNLPTCITWLTTQTNVRDDDAEIGTNYMGMQLAAFLASTPLSPLRREELILGMAKNRAASNKTKKSESEIVKTLRTKLTFASGRGTMHFSCPAMRKMFPKSNPPCANCPILSDKQKLLEAEHNIGLRDSGYCRVDDNGAAFPFTNWYLEPTAIYCPEGDGENAYQGAEFILFRDGKRYGRLTTDNLAFTSKRELAKAVLAKFPGLIFDGDDVLAQKLWRFIYDSNDMQRLTRVTSIGIHHFSEQSALGSPIEGFVYVEPNWSINSDNISGTHRFDGRDDGTVARLRGCTIPSPTDTAFIEAMLAMLSINSPHAVGLIVGWVAACHLRAHFFFNGPHQFPLLHMYGTAGSGKTMQAQVFAMLGGSNQIRTGVPTVKGTTAKPFKRMATSTTTVPRIIDEMREGDSRGYYWIAHDICKAAYTMNALQTGMQRDSDERHHGVTNERVTAPFIYLAPAATTNEELRTRSIEVYMNKKVHEIPECKDSWQFLLDGAKDELFRGAKLLMKRALGLPPETTLQMFKDEAAACPVRIDERSVVNYSMPVVGLNFMSKVFADSMFPAVLLDKIDAVRDATREWLAGNKGYLKTRRSESELVSLIKALATLASFTKNGIDYELVTPHQYLRTPRHLHVNIHAAFITYLQHVRSLRLPAEYSSPESIIDLMRNEPFFVSYGQPPLPNLHGSWLTLDCKGLQDVGVDIGLFKLSTGA